MLKFSETTAQTFTHEQLMLFPKRNAAVWDALTDEQTILTVLDGQQLIGCALLAQTSDAKGAVRVQLLDLNIHADFARQGMGRTLLSVAASKAMQWGATVLYAAAPEDEIAAAFCKKTGFIPVSDTLPAMLVLDLTDTKGMRHGG